MKALLKRVRASQPLNLVTTSATRAVLRALGTQSPFIVQHLHRVGTVRCPLPNGRQLMLWSRGDDWVSNQLYWRGLAGYEPETVDVFVRYASAARVVIDVGAYVGFYTLLAAQTNPQCRVYAFEPHPQAYARLTRNVTLNRVSNVECLELAAGGVEGESRLWSVRSELPTSSSLSRDFMAAHADVGPIAVRAVRLDRFLDARGAGPVGLVKIDTESTEPQVLCGLGDLLGRDRPAIICEVLPERGSGPELERLLAPLGYRYHVLTSDGPRRTHHIEPHSKWLNHLFTCGDVA